MGTIFVYIQFFILNRIHRKTESIYSFSCLLFIFVLLFIYFHNSKEMDPLKEWKEMGRVIRMLYLELRMRKAVLLSLQQRKYSIFYFFSSLHVSLPPSDFLFILVSKLLQC